TACAEEESSWKTRCNAGFRALTDLIQPWEIIMRMNRAAAAALALPFFISACPLAHGAGKEEGPLWAYPQRPADMGPRGPEDTALKSVPNSTLQKTLRDAESTKDVPDWHPDNHPPAPDIILHSHDPISESCGHCHLPNGRGGPMTAPA